MSTRRLDPLRNFKFQVQIIHHNDTAAWARDIERLGFMSVTGINVTNELIPYREGGWNTSPHKMVGQTDFGPITFLRGMFGDGRQNVWSWQRAMYAYQWGDGNLDINGDYRADVLVKVMEHPVTRHGGGGAVTTNPATGNPDFDSAYAALNPQARLAIMFYNTWPGGFALNDLNAGDNALLIQQMTFHHEGFDVVEGEAAVNFGGL